MREAPLNNPVVSENLPIEICRITQEPQKQTAFVLLRIALSLVESNLVKFRTILKSSIFFEENNAYYVINIRN